MTIKRGTYRFTYTGSNYDGWLHDRYGDACGADLKGYIIGDEGEGMIVLEGDPSDVDALSADIQQDSDTSNFNELLEEGDVSSRYKQFAKFKPSDASKRCS